MKTILLLTLCALGILAGAGLLCRERAPLAHKTRSLPAQIPNIQAFFPHQRIH